MWLFRGSTKEPAEDEAASPETVALKASLKDIDATLKQREQLLLSEELKLISLRVSCGKAASKGATKLTPQLIQADQTRRDLSIQHVTKGGLSTSEQAAKMQQL